MRSWRARPRSVFIAEITVSWHAASAGGSEVSREEEWKKEQKAERKKSKKEAREKVLTLIRCSELIGEHRVDDRLNVRWVGIPGTVVNFCFASKVVCSMTCLKDVQCSSHVTLRELQQGLLPVCRQFHTVTNRP